MAKFKQAAPQSFLFRKLVEFWGNMVRNYNGNIHDDDFFDIIREYFDRDEAIDVIRNTYSEGDLSEMEEHHRHCEIDFDPVEMLLASLWNYESKRDKCRAALEEILRRMTARLGDGKEDGLARRFAELRSVFKLSELEGDLLLIAYIHRETCFEWPCRVADREKPLYYAMAIDRSCTEVDKAMSASGRLRRYDVLDGEWDFNCQTIGGFLDGSEGEAIERRFYKRADMDDVLPWEFYGDLGKNEGAIISRMLKASRGKLNILLYGAPGTGKTSFARSLAQKNGLSAFEIKQGDSDGKNMKAEARMIGIRICNEQEDAKGSVVIVDEADELLRGGVSFMGMPFVRGRKSTEKGVMNTLLDEVKIPTIWISNTSAWEMDESVRRRFDYSVCFERMNTAQRASIWKNVVAKLKLGDLVTEGKIAEYAEKYETSAGGIAIVMKNVKRLKPTAARIDELVDQLMKPHCKLMGIRKADGFLPAKGYSLDGLNIKGKVKLDKIVKSVRNFLDDDFNASAEDKPRMNILMYGPPGTGKTEFVKYLGRELDRRVMVVKGSDLLSKYVGESEQNIAEAFSRAEAERSILFFDEIDGLVQSRERAQASWEVTQVNELLQQMENFGGVMIAATNFSRNLDQAIMRRFTFKLEFGYLDDAGKRVFFERMFNTTLSDDELARLSELQNLAPGDFRTVRQEMFYLGDEQTNMDRIAALKEECALKKCAKPRPHIGFGISRT